MTGILGMEFMQNALWAALLASVAYEVIGSLVVVNRQVFMAGGVAHTAYGGVGLAPNALAISQMSGEFALPV